ncbi:MAG TPA: hypothetical protein VK210_08080, partial [Terriglobia bacterium]|nr:hypothetical protein [Terriglobia bacterium]
MKQFRFALISCVLLAVSAVWVVHAAQRKPASPLFTIDTPMEPPEWARLERQLLDAQTPAIEEYYHKYYDSRGYVQCVVRWGADDGPDDAFENMAGWPELHALGGSDEVLRLTMQGVEGMLKQYTEAKTTQVPAGLNGMYYKEFSTQSDWMHHGEALRVFNRMGLSVPTDSKYRARAKRYAAMYMGEDSEAPNYDSKLKLIRSLINGSRGPMLRKATALDWVGDPIDIQNFTAGHNERNFDEMLAHYVEYDDVTGDSFLNLVATTLPLDAYLTTGESKYKKWIVDYMDAWLDRMKRNNGVIPSFVDIDGKIGGPDGKWWGNAYGWGFSPINPVTGRREDRNRIPRALVGFNNALWVTGDSKYIDAWRNMIDAVNANATTVNGRKQYPTMYGANGWYGWQAQPWNVGALEVWYWSMKPEDLERAGRNNPWIAYLQGANASYPETALRSDLRLIETRLTRMRADHTTAAQRLADNMMDFNPAAVDALIRLTLGGLPPGRDGGLLNARLRYFDPARQRAGLPDNVAALVSQMTDTQTAVTLINLDKAAARTVVVQGGAYGEHRIETVESAGKVYPVNGRSLTVQLAAGAGARILL